MNIKFKTYTAYILIAPLFIIGFIWLMSVLSLGIGAVAPYVILADSGFGFVRVAIFGSAFHIAMVVILATSIYIVESLKLHTACLLLVGISELVLISAYSAGFLFTW